MHDASWTRTASGPWLVVPRVGGQEVVAGITFGSGQLHQPVEKLGVAALLAAYLTTALTRPVEAVDTSVRDDSVQVAFALGQTESSLVVVGTSAAVAAALGRVDHLLATASTVELDDGLIDRARAYPNSIQPWSSHLAARWPGHRPYLSALGPLSLSGLRAADLGAFAAEQFGTAARVYWTNEPTLVGSIAGAGSVSSSVSSAAGPGASGGRPGPGSVAPQGWRDEPGCVVSRSVGEMFTIAVRETPAAQVGLSLLARLLHRRTVEFEPLASAIRLQRHRVGGEVLLICGVADVLPGKEEAIRRAITQTLEDCAEGSVAGEEIDRTRKLLVAVERSAEGHLPHAMRILAARHLESGDFPTPEILADAYERVTDEQVRTVLGELYRQLLLAIPVSGTAEAPFPMVNRAAVRRATGRRFRERLNPRRLVRCTADRVTLVEVVPVGRGRSGGRPVTRASVDFDEVVLRLDADDQYTTLVDERFGTVQLIWDRYRRGAALRELVDRRTDGVPVIRIQPDEEWAARFAAELRRYRRNITLGIVAAVVAAGLAVTAIVMDTRSDQPVVRTVDVGATITLGNGTTIGTIGEPELIEHYNASITNILALQMRMCAGEDHRTAAGNPAPRNYFSAEKFQLLLGEQTASRLGPAIAERPGPRGDYLDEGECATGWLLFQLPEATMAVAPAVRYTNIEDDRLTWRLASDVPASPLSKPCPQPIRNLSGHPITVPWVGCPDPPR